MLVRLSPDALRNRLRADFSICQRMSGHVFTVEAYRSKSDLEQRRNPITSVDQGHLATKYRVDFHVKTLVGRGQFANLTTIGLDLDRPNYPYDEPWTWVISSPVPYSPHFQSGSPVCIGDFWTAAQGKIPLGRLFVHIAKLLNWDEIPRGGGYVGWNGDAILYHQEVYHGRPITENLPYPVPPTDLMLGGKVPSVGETMFRSKGQPTLPDSSLFRKRG